MRSKQLTQRLRLMLNKGHAVHVVFALLIQVALSPLLGLEGGALVAVTFYVAREYAQMEAKCSKQTGLPIAQMMPWHCLRREYVTLDAVLDWVLPAIACGGISYLY